MTRTFRHRRRRLPSGTPAPANLYDRTGIIGASEVGRRAGDPLEPAERGGLRHAALVMGAAAALFFVGWLGTHGVPQVPTPLETAQAPVQAPPRVLAEPEPVVEKPAVPPETPKEEAPKPATAVVAASETKAKKKPEPKKKPAATAEARSDLPVQTTQPKPKNPVEQFEEQFEQLVGPVFDQMVSQARGGR
ncbi:hypothetical protein [Amycolatopsis albispora]|uniref:Uncharacterized protein n=1 Tax=Amycolatopsis albispora TaxID=1804986 RepID=A0A344LCS4_9PSEU|nr:hypothetical protein [Amycolatopsis albispora]AXB45848.1 hypothetical protein A4R43_27990 [Amycolatopsis albispora]